MRTVIAGGTVVGPTGADESSVLVEDDKVVALLSPAFAEGLSVDAVIDARGTYVVPGGVDAHTHMEMPFGGTTASDSFETGSRLRRGAVRRRLSTSRSRLLARTSRSASSGGRPRPTASALSTTAST